MNIAIFGADGEIGLSLTKKAISKGNSIVVYISKNSDYAYTDDQLTTISGDFSDHVLIEQAVNCADVVISLLELPLNFRRFRGTPVAYCHFLIIEAMEQLNKKRFITLATPTVISASLAKSLYPNTYLEMKKIEMLLRNSILDWTIVQIANPKVKPRRLEQMIKTESASLSDHIASFILDLVIKNSHINQTPVVFN